MGPSTRTCRAPRAPGVQSPGADRRRQPAASGQAGDTRRQARCRGRQTATTPSHSSRRRRLACRTQAAGPVVRFNRPLVCERCRLRPARPTLLYESPSTGIVRAGLHPDVPRLGSRARRPHTACEPATAAGARSPSSGNCAGSAAAATAIGVSAPALMLAMSVARAALPARHDDERSEAPDGAHHVAQELMRDPTRSSPPRGASRSRNRRPA